MAGLPVETSAGFRLGSVTLPCVRRASVPPRLLSAGAHARGHPQRRHRRPRRPWEDDARGRDALAVRLLPGEPGRRRARPRLDGPRAREGHHDPGEEHRRSPRRREDQHRRHAGPCGLRRRGRARADDGGRRAAPGRRERGASSADPLRAAQGARGAAPGDPRREQGRPARRARRRGRRRGLRALPRPGRGREPDRVPDRVRERQGRARRARGGFARARISNRSSAPSSRASRPPRTRKATRCRRT